jgi:hypothetical protein
MTKRKRYTPPGWDRMQVFWSYSVAFKKARGKRLYWVTTKAQNETDASRRARAWMSKYFPRDDWEDWIEYGISKSYGRFWGGYSEPITKEEYEWAVGQGLSMDPPAVFP